MTAPAPQGGAGSDDPTGRDLFGWQDRPNGNLWEGIVRTSFSNGRSIDSYDDSQSSLSSSRTTSPSLPSTAIVPIGRCGAGRSTVSPGAAPSSCCEEAGNGKSRNGGCAAACPEARHGGLAAAPGIPEVRRAVRGGCCAGRGGAVLDPRRLTVRRRPNGRVRSSRAVSRRVRCSADVVQFAVGADCCGALGCGVEEPLLSVEVGGDSRVLCPDYAAEFVRGRSQ